MSETRRGMVMVIRRGDPEIAAAIEAGIMEARGTTGDTSSAPFGGTFQRAYRPRLAENSPQDCFPGARRPSRGRLLEGRGTAEPRGRLLEGGGQLSREEIEVVSAEIDRQKILADLVRVAVNNTNTPEDYQIMTVKARGDYGKYSRPAGPLRRLARKLLGVYGLTVLAVAAAYRAQDRVLGE